MCSAIRSSRGSWVTAPWLHRPASLATLTLRSVKTGKALGLNVDECHGLPVSIRIESAELRPAAPNLSMTLHGKVQGWLCKPFKTHLTPELEVTAQTTISLGLKGRIAVAAGLGLSKQPI